MSQILKEYFYCTFLGYNLYFFSRFFVLFWGDEPVATLEVHASQGLKVGLYTPTILGGNSYLSWFYDREAIKDPAHTGTSKGLSQAINRGPSRKFLSKYANVTIQSHGLSAGARTHYVTANGVRNGPTCYWPHRP